MSRSRGFTLLEIMVALALLGLGLVVLIKSSANNIRASEESHMMGIATDLARGKMYDIEEQLLKDGFTDTDQSQTDAKPFDAEGWPNIYYSYKVDQVEMPDFDQLTAMSQGRAGSGAYAGTGSNNYYGSAFGSAYGSAFGSDAFGGFQNSALGSMLGMFGGGSTAGVTGGQAGALIQSQYSMFQQILKASVRKVTLTVTWNVMGNPSSMKIVCFFTDASAMDKVLNGMGSQDISDSGSGAGSGTGSGSRTTATPGRGSGALK